MPRRKKEEKKETNDYLSTEERAALTALHKRMETARDERNAPRDEFDGLGYLEAYDLDTKSALAYIAPTKNDGENAVSTGTTRQAMISLVSRAMSYNYTTEFHAFDKTDSELANVGAGLATAVRHANYLDHDEDQAKERTAELLSHGDAFTFEDWVEEWAYGKPKLPLNGKITGVNWTETKKKVFEGCRRQTVQGRRMYVGDVFCVDMDRQPFAFMVNHVSPAQAKLKYGEWERWKNVPGEYNDTFDQSSYAEDWEFEKGDEGSMTEIIYVDLPNREMQFLLNGVPMLPMGFPNRWDHDRYPWAHEGAEPIRSGFFYHRSFVRTLRNMQEIEDDMWRVIIMLAWKAALPPLANQTGQVITRRQLVAGNIIDVNADDLKPIYDGSLANTNFVREVAGMIRQNMMSRSVPELKQGATPPGTSTATEIVQLNREAEVAISLNLQSAANIQAKADWLRAGNLLQFAMVNGYRASADRPGRAGMMRDMIEVKDELDDSKTLMDREDEMENSTGVKPKIVQVSENAKNLIYRLEARAMPKPRQSSALDRQELSQLFQAARAIFGNVNPEMFENAFKAAYGLAPDTKLTAETSEADLAKLQAGMSPAKQPLPTAQESAGAMGL